MTRLVVSAAVGVVVGVLTENPYLGFQAGAATYGATGFLDPTKKLVGSKLSDLSAPSASYGSPENYLEGSPRSAPDWIWSSQKRAVSHTSNVSGKGGPKVTDTEFTYELDCLLLVSCNPVAAVRRIFLNGKLVWSRANDATSASLLASTSTNAWRQIEFFDGNDVQLPWDVYEAAVGVGRAPAMRGGRFTIGITGLNLGNSGQVPVISVETVSVSAPSAVLNTFTTLPPPYSGQALGIGSSPFSPLGFRVHVGQWDTTYTSSLVVVYDVYPDGTYQQVGTYDANSNAPSANGQTDVAGIMGVHGIGSPGPDSRAIFWDEYDGEVAIPYHFELPIGEDFSSSMVFCMRGDVVVFASANSFQGSSKVYRFSKSAALNSVANPAATSVAMPNWTHSLATDGTVVYRLNHNAGTIDVLDVATMTVQSTIALDYPNSSDGILLVDENSVLYYASDAYSGVSDCRIAKWTGSAWVNMFPGLTFGVGASAQAWGISEGVVFHMLPGTGTGPALRVFDFLQTITPASVSLDGVVRRVIERGGDLVDADIDTSALAGINCRAFFLTQVEQIRAAVDTLSSAYLFDLCEGGTLKAVARGGSSLVTIPYADLGTSIDGSAEPLPIKRSNEQESPAVTSISYANMANDFQQDLQRADRLTPSSTGENVVQLPIGFLPVEAKRLADAATLDQALQITAIGPVALPRKYAYLQPSDVFTLTGADGSHYRVRATKTTYGGGIMLVEIVLDDPHVIASTATTDTDYPSASLVSGVALSRLALIDGPILRDQDDGLGPYAAVTRSGVGLGAFIDRSTDGGANFTTELSISGTTALGYCVTRLGDYTGGNAFDDVSSFYVNVGTATLSSGTRSDAINGTGPSYAVGSGDDVEILVACTATLSSSSPNVYRLSNLLRGRRGTEQNCGKHNAADQVVLLQTAGMAKLSDASIDLNVVRDYKAVTYAGSIANAIDVPFTDTGIALKPFAPVGLRVDPVASPSPAVVWDRRSRYASRFLQTAIVPLGEATESYDVELRNLSHVVVDSQTVTTSSYTIPTGLGSTAGFVVTIYQNSAVVGHGYPASITV